MSQARLRVLHVTTGLATGGAERVLFGLLRGGLAATHETSVLSLTDLGTYGQRIQDLGVTVSALGLSGVTDALPALWQLRKYVSHLRPDLIQGWMYHGNFAAWLTLQGFVPRHCALVWNIRHSLYGLGNEKPLSRWVIRGNRLVSSRTDLVIYNSYVSRKLHEDFGFASACSRVVPNGFDLDEFKPSLHTKQHIRGELGIPDDAFVVGHIARFHPMKDHSNFLRAVTQVIRNHSNVFAILIGKNIDWNNEMILREIPPDLEKNVRLLGERRDIPDILRALDMLCLSSAWGEAFPNVLGEAMATGVPCIATDVGDSSIIIGDTGFTVPPCNLDALASAIESFITLPSQTRISLGRAARARIEANYSLPKSVAHYEALYQELYDKKERQ